MDKRKEIDIVNQEIIRDINDDRTAAQPEQGLSPCPCGEKAAYYRAARPLDTTPGRGKAVSAMAANDFHENLCGECFRAAFGADEQDGWVRLSP